MTELLITVMRDHNVGAVWLVLFLIVLWGIYGIYRLMLAGRIKIEWFGTGCRHIFRWLRCKIRDKHYWEAPLYFSTSAPSPRCRTCRICGKVEVRR